MNDMCVVCKRSLHVVGGLYYLDIAKDLICANCAVLIADLAIRNRWNEVLKVQEFARSTPPFATVAAAQARLAQWLKNGGFD